MIESFRLLHEYFKDFIMFKDSLFLVTFVLLAQADDLPQGISKCFNLCNGVSIQDLSFIIPGYVTES